MADFTKVKKNLEINGWKVTVFETKEEAAEYLNKQIDNTTVAFGGCATADKMGLYESLGTHNKAVYWHWKQEMKEALRNAQDTEAYISSVNALAEEGCMVNIDGRGNRVASTLWGHQRVFFVIGKNKLVPTYDDAVYRAKNYASPIRGMQLHHAGACGEYFEKTGEYKCFNCKKADRGCRTMVTYWCPSQAFESEVILINEDLGI